MNFNSDNKKKPWMAARQSINESSRSRSHSPKGERSSKRRWVKINMPSNYPSVREKELGHKIHSRIVDIRSSRHDLSNKSLKRLITEF